MTDLADAISQLHRLNEIVPRPLRLPTPDEVADAERRLAVPFSADFRRFLLEASDVVVGVLEPCVVIPNAGSRDLVATALDAWGAWGVPRDWLPFCEDNADFYCLVGDGVRYWSHNGLTGDAWPDLAT